MEGKNMGGDHICGFIFVPLPLVSNNNSLAEFLGRHLWHGPGDCRPESGGGIILSLLGEPFQHGQCASGQPDERFPQTSLNLEPTRGF